MADILSYTIEELSQKLAKQEISSLELTKAYLDSIKKQDKNIHAFLSVDEALALADAKKADTLLKDAKNITKLTGIPYGVKDAILVEGMVCSAGSKMLKDYIAPYDATVIIKLKKAGAVILGKTNMDEFGMGASTENSAFGVTKNPHDVTRVPGGSSGGSSAAVSAHESVFALGEDTGGSIRLPASFCGVVGLKPTYGAVSRYGIIAFASSLDQVGPITKTVDDCKIVFQAISGQDPMDSTTVELKLKKPERKKLRIGVPKEFFTKGLDKDVEKVIKDTIGKLGNKGAIIKEVSLPNLQYGLAAYYIINMSEASANLARYDGIRYGHRGKKAKNLREMYEENRGEGFGEEVKRRIMLGTYALSAGYYDAYYLQAQKMRTLLLSDFEKVFKDVDVVAGPVSPVLPFKIGERIGDPMSMYLVDAYTVPANLTGLPALSVPAGKVGKLPVGMQFISGKFEEPTLFAAGKMLEKIYV
ncbi:MAG: Asp-tRNA(Asn)/Glu-tRNA(Gln) amidotransferase subunit GatA [Patescibacteria group bacterium]|nr:Asp-tRNA(Asn)/Glu-tRNA(Gln) amidotransferase subunit GatA [Patescibacteria group bacterium]